MDTVWLVMPSKRPPEDVKPILQLWIERGYGILIQRDDTEANIRQPGLDAAAVHYRPYHGYADAVNYLAQQVFRYCNKAQWIVAAGDDTEPDANHSAEEIAQQCEEHFACSKDSRESILQDATYGVMQPTGDRWGTHANALDPKMRGAYIDRVAGSPWLGREFCLRVNQGNGPLWPEYYHMYADEELQNVATRLGVFWQRPDLIHLHRHWGRPRDGERMAPRSRMPAFLEKANAGFAEAKELFMQRQAAGFPGSEPL